MMDNVNIIIYPIQYSRKAYPDHWRRGQTKMSRTKGRVVDHIAFSVDNLVETLNRISDVKVLQPPRSLKDSRFKRAFIEGPDYIQIELIQEAK
jgi:4-hydroxyphenylpyruvate dioxygenase-like putative hemolysin